MTATGLALCTGADEGYFPLLAGCLRSIRDKPEGGSAALCVLDLGLSSEQRAWVETVADRVAEPGWDLEVPGREGLPRHFRGLTARPFLPRYFPGFATYLWLDADAWVQDWAAVALYRQAAAEGVLAVTPEIDRAYRLFYAAGPEFRRANYAAYREAFGTALAAELILYPLLNSGAFALAAGAPHWEAWGETLAAGLARSRNPLVEQAALNVAVYKRELPARFLPAWCNWICHHATPVYDARRGRFVEPSPPHQPLGILHLTLHTKQAGTLPVPVIGADGRPGEAWPMSLRYPGAEGR